MSYSYTYTEKLNDTTVEVNLPETRDEAFEIYHEIQALADRDPKAWKAAVRLWTASDLYIMGLHHSWWLRRDPWYDRAEIDCDFQFDFARWVQFESDDVLDYSARGHGKSTWRHTRITQEIVRDPNVTIGIFSFDLSKGSRKHLIRWKSEIEANAVLRNAWDDVFYWNAVEEKAFWSVEKGCTVKRQMSSIVPTVSAWTFMRGLPTGSRFGVIYPDDCETEETVESEDQRHKIIERFQSMIDLGGRGTRIWPVGTYHHPNGLLGHLIKKGWKAHNFPAEDVSKPAPDIEEIYDELGGKRPDTGADIPKKVKDVQLDGDPVYLHPMECAIKRFQQGNSRYLMQSQGDPLAGQTMRLQPEWIADELRIRADLRDWAQGKYGYLLSDPSKGLHDNSVGIMLVTDSDGTMVVVDAFRAKYSPGEWARQCYLMCISWERIVSLRQARIEVFGQATWDHNLREFFQKERYAGPPVYAVGTHLGNRSNQSILRAWTRLEPMFRNATLRLPQKLIVTDENDAPYDFIDYFVQHEYDPFPLPDTDDILSTLALIGEPAEKCPPMEFPDREVPWATEEREWGNRGPLENVPGIDPDSFLWQ